MVDFLVSFIEVNIPTETVLTGRPSGYDTSRPTGYDSSSYEPSLGRKCIFGVCRAHGTCLVAAKCRPVSVKYNLNIEANVVVTECRSSRLLRSTSSFLNFIRMCLNAQNISL